MRNLFSAVLVAAALGLGGAGSGCLAAEPAGAAIDLWVTSPAGHLKQVRHMRTTQRAAKAHRGTRQGVTASAARTGSQAQPSKRVVRKRLRKVPVTPDYIPVNSPYRTSVA